MSNKTVEKDINDVLNLVKDFKEYHNETLPLCAAENVISDFANLPLNMGFQERYIMNNTYSFNMDDNFIGCEKLFPFYQKLSEVCERVFKAKYTDPRPFTGMNCIDMIGKTLCNPGDKIMILGKEYGGHASVKPVLERIGLQVFDAPYDIDKYDLDYGKLNSMVKEEKIGFILLAPSDIIKPLDVEKIDTTDAVLLYDCSQLMGLIAAGVVSNPLEKMKNIVLFGGTHKTFPGPASGLILTNEESLHEKMEREINPKYLRHSQMHQKISLLFSLIEFEEYGKKYMEHMVHCSNYLGSKLKEKGYDIVSVDNQYSFTHQVFLRCSQELTNTIYENAYKCKVTLNKKHKKLFNDYGIRFGTQEIARYNYQDSDLDVVVEIISNLTKTDVDVNYVNKLKDKLPKKEVNFAFDDSIISKFVI